jgi:hypothetical protein
MSVKSFADEYSVVGLKQDFQTMETKIPILLCSALFTLLIYVGDLYRYDQHR